jgi:uncharacterized protein (DUF302 family)
MQYGQTIHLSAPYREVLGKVREALRRQGFGVLTEIDVTATLKAKIGADMEPYVILGACNPRLAHRALDVDRSLGLLLPCNVVVRADGDGTLVQVLDPQVMVEVPDKDELRPIADEAGRLLRAVLAELSGDAGVA